LSTHSEVLKELEELDRYYEKCRAALILLVSDFEPTSSEFAVDAIHSHRPEELAASEFATATISMERLDDLRALASGRRAWAEHVKV
jgi:hypothetical protein